MLRTRHRETILFDACLSAKQSMVIDNTNVTKELRKRYIEPALEAEFIVKGYYFQSKITDALLRNQGRPDDEKVPDKAILGMAGQLEFPTLDEGFHQLYYVSITSDNQFLVEEWIGE